MTINESLSYLAATIDMEGCIGFYRPSSPFGQIDAIFNTDWKLIQHVCGLLDELGIYYIIGEAGNHRLSPNYNRCWRVRVLRKADQQKLLLAIAPYLVSPKKRNKAAQVLLWTR